MNKIVIGSVFLAILHSILFFGQDWGISVSKVTSSNFEEEVIESEVPVLLDFWASWCEPCKMVSPIVDEVANEVQNNAKVGKVNVDEEETLAQSFEITSIPTLIVIKNGKEVNRAVGVRNREEILQLLNI